MFGDEPSAIKIKDVLGAYDAGSIRLEFCVGRLLLSISLYEDSLNGLDHDGKR